ncbi:uncharacterized protein TNCV_506991 [Trichonephila clavipes]|nr:uncharacterized protein TNCV_506991 [Trichonephila clavipes]
MECVKRESCPICNGSHHFSICFRNRHDDDLSPKRDTDNIVSAVIKTDSEDILTMSVIVNESNICKQLSEFWDLENLGIEAEVSDEENIDNDIMSEFEGISYQNKRYKVKFPWKPNMKTLLENNEEIARKRFLKLRSRFKNDSSLFEDYKLVVNNYLSEKIIERVPFEAENLKQNIFYLPHRAVIRTDKTTSKLRIVFDASSHVKSQLSLNDCLHTGLNFIPNLFFLLIKFRVNPIAFLMIEIGERERDFTRFFWDENPEIDLENKRLDIFRMTRVLFGVKSSPFLLAATMKHHLKKYVDIFPDTFNHLNQSLYVDDFLCGNISVQAALTAYSMLLSLVVQLISDAGSTGIGKGTTFVMARFKIPVEVFTLTTLTRPSLPGNTSRIRPIGPHGSEDGSDIRCSKVPKFVSQGLNEFPPGMIGPEVVYGSGKDEIAQFVKKMPRDQGLRSLGSEESGDKGREFRTASICVINVVNSSKFMIANLNKMRFMDLMFLETIHRNGEKRVE